MRHYGGGVSGVQGVPVAEIWLAFARCFKTQCVFAESFKPSTCMQTNSNPTSTHPLSVTPLASSYHKVNDQETWLHIKSYHFERQVPIIFEVWHSARALWSNLGSEARDWANNGIDFPSIKLFFWCCDHVKWSKSDDILAVTRQKCVEISFVVFRSQVLRVSHQVMRYEPGAPKVLRLEHTRPECWNLATHFRCEMLVNVT